MTEKKNPNPFINLANEAKKKNAPMINGKKTEQNPWKSNTLEWTTPVEHIHGNWPGMIPEVHRWPYDYSKRVDPNDDNSDYLHGKDFVLQTTPLLENEEVS